MQKPTKYDYFNKDELEKKIRERDYAGFTQQWCSLILSALGLLSLIILIILNITTLIKTYQGNEKEDKCIEYFKHVADTVETVSEDLLVELKPKITLIASATSYTIPSMINSAEATIAREIGQNCNGGGGNGSGTCPNQERLFHASQVSMINRRYTDLCIQHGGSIKSPSPIKFESYPSFVPPPTIPNGCANQPSFSMSSTIFSYVQTVDTNGCNFSIDAFQTWILGYIGISPSGKPEPRASKIWDMGNLMPRKGCSTVAGPDYAWLGCTLKYWSDSMDYTIYGVNHVYIGYQDVYGNKREWTLPASSIQFDYKWDAMAFGIGSGVIIEGRVYFLVYGVHYNDNYQTDFCQHDGCNDINQEKCNSASKPKIANNRRILNGVFFFSDNPNIKPKAYVHTITPANNWQGGKGRLFYDQSTDKIFVYTQSTGWHANLQLGFIYRGFPFNISWINYKSLSRPGIEPCGNDSVCPNECVTGVYTDVYPITSDLQNVIGVTLLSKNTFKNPVVVTAQPDKIISSYQIYDENQGAFSTTTTCFGFEIDIWCMSIVEVEMSNNNDFYPIPFLYKLEIDCDKDDWWSRIRNHQYIVSLLGKAR